MADNIAITPGTGATAATDDVGGVHYAKVKLFDPTADSSTGIGISSNPMRVDPTGTTTQPVSISGTPTVSISGTPSVSVSGTPSVAQSGTWTVQPGNTANTTPWLTTTLPTTSGGLSTYFVNSAATTNGANVKSSAGQVYGWAIFNTTSSAKFVRLYNMSTSPTVGTSTVFMTIYVPATGGTNVQFSNGIAFGTGISISITGAVGNSDTTAVAANDVIVNLFYK